MRSAGKDETEVLFLWTRASCPNIVCGRDAGACKFHDHDPCFLILHDLCFFVCFLCSGYCLLFFCKTSSLVILFDFTSLSVLHLVSVAD